MRFVPGGPDVPNALIVEQQRGNVLFVCGAGVSMAAGLPSFRSLVTGIYGRLGENWDRHPAERAVMEDCGRLAGQYDRVLRILERRLEASDVRASRGMRHRLREAVEQELAPGPSPDLSHHLALLELSTGGDGAVRLLTTNFDTLFERSWFDAGERSCRVMPGQACRGREPAPSRVSYICTDGLKTLGWLSPERISS